MPRPTSSLSTQRPDLRMSFEEYPLLAESRGYVGMRLLTPLEVPTQAGTYGVLPLEQVKRPIGLSPQRAVGTGYRSTDWKFETVTYSTKDYGEEVPIDDREEAMFGDYVAAEQDSAAIARIRLWDWLENDMVTTLTTSSVYTGGSLTAAAATAWTTYASAVPLTDISNAIYKVWQNTGMRPNAICMGWRDMWHLKMCAQVQSMIQYTNRSGPGDIPDNAIADMLDIPEVVVAGVPYNSATVEDGAATIASIWPVGKIWVGIKASEGATHRVPSVGRTHHWGGDGSVIGGVPETYRNEQIRGDVVRVRTEVDPKRIYTECAFIITGASS